MASSTSITTLKQTRSRGSRLGFRVDAETKRRVERAAALERRSLTDFCLAALNEASEAAISRHQTLVLTEREREIFFDTLVHPPEPNAKLRQAFRDARKRIFHK